MELPDGLDIDSDRFTRDAQCLQWYLKKFISPESVTYGMLLLASLLVAIYESCGDSTKAVGKDLVAKLLERIGPVDTRTVTVSGYIDGDEHIQRIFALFAGGTPSRRAVAQALMDTVSDGLAQLGIDATSTPVLRGTGGPKS